MSPSRRILTVSKAHRETMMQAAMVALVKHFGKKVGIMLFTFDFGTGNNFLSYKSNANRADALEVLKEWLKLNSGEPVQGTEELPPS